MNKPSIKVRSFLDDQVNNNTNNNMSEQTNSASALKLVPLTTLKEVKNELGVKSEIKDAPLSDTEPEDTDVDEHMDDDQNVRAAYTNNELNVGLDKPESQIDPNTLNSNVEERQILDHENVQNSAENHYPVFNSSDYQTFKSDNSLDVLYQQRLSVKVREAKKVIQKFAEHVKYYRETLTNIITNNELKYDGFFCKFDPPKQCPIERSLTGKWKFKFEKNVVRTTDNLNDELTADNSEVHWSISRSNEPVKVEDEDSGDIPPYIADLVKFFENFLNNSPVIQREAARNSSALNKNKKEFHSLQLRSNYNFEVMAIIYAYNVTGDMRESLRNHLKFSRYPKLVSVYVKSGMKKKFTDIVYGQRELTEFCGNIKFTIDPYIHFYSNISGIELLKDTISEIIQPFKYDTVLMIGSRLGFINLLLAKDFDKLIGIDDEMSTLNADKLRAKNKIYNVTYVNSKNPDQMKITLNEVKNRSFFVIIDNSTPDGKSPSLTAELHKIKSLKHIIVISTFNMNHAKSLLKLFDPLEEKFGYPFFPERGCIVDPTPTSNYYQAVVLFQRSAIVRFKRKKTDNIWIPTINLKKEKSSKSEDQVKVKKETSLKETASEDRSEQVIADRENIEPQIKRKKKNHYTSDQEKTRETEKSDEEMERSHVRESCTKSNTSLLENENCRKTPLNDNSVEEGATSAFD